MTKKDVAQLINKHSLKPLVSVVVLISVGQILNGLFFEGAPISPILIAILSIGACLYTFQKVLAELFAKEDLPANNEQK